MVHELLYGTSALRHIDIGMYTENLTRLIGDTLAPTAVAEIKTDTLRLNIDQAVPFGLALNELVTNAFKYGSPSGGTDIGRGSKVSRPRTAGSPHRE